MFRWVQVCLLRVHPDFHVTDQYIVVFRTALGAELGECLVVLNLASQRREREARLLRIEDRLRTEESGGRLFLVLLKWGEVVGFGRGAEMSQSHVDADVSALQILECGTVMLGRKGKPCPIQLSRGSSYLAGRHSPIFCRTFPEAS